MITRAFIEDIDWDAMKVQVRIPRFDGVGDSPSSTSKMELNWASVVCIPGLEIRYKVGDCVVVGFEDNDLGKPIVLGYLGLKGKTLDSRIQGKVESLEVLHEFKAPYNTIIGKTPYSGIYQAAEDATNKEE